MNECNQSLLDSFKTFLETYEKGKSGPNVNTSQLSDVSQIDVSDGSVSEVQTVVLRSRATTDSCFFSDHKISASDVEPEVFDWIFYHLDFKKCPHPLAFALASIVARKLGLAETTRESHNSDADKSKPAISSNELYSQSLEYLTDFINSWKKNPEIALEIAKEYSTQRYPSSICAIKNIRRKMEDRHVVLHDLNKALALKTPKQYSYYAIFDGHAGVDAASYASAHLHYNMVQSQAFLDGDIVGAFKEAFSLTDLHYLERSAREGKKSGSTALCALLEEGSKIYVAWLGDSLAILVKNGKPIDIMTPHKPDLEEERKRIEEMGGFVAFVDTWRVNGTLAVSRAIGDPEYKPYISSEPDVVKLDIDSDTDFLIMACDGLWDQLTPEEASSLVYEYICENSEQNIDDISRNISKHLSSTAKFDGSSDNITTIVIFFKDLDQLRATPFTPLTPREKETNGLNGNHFQYNDFEFTQSAKNPFDSSDSTPDPMNVTKLNLESSNSFNSSENSTIEVKGISNPFITNEYSFADLNKPFDMSADNNHFNNESSLLKESTNSFEINDKLESNTSHTISNDCSELQSFQSDSQFNISKLSEISSSFPTQAVIHSDHALCSTPNQTFDQFSDLNSSSCQQNIVLETNMDLTDDTKASHHMSAVGSEMDETYDQSFGSVGSEVNESSFDKSGYQTAYEFDIEKNLEDHNSTNTPLKSPINLEEVCEKVFGDIDEHNQSQDINDFSSGAESVDSFCYEKIGSDLSKISEKVANDFQFQQIYSSIPTDFDQQFETQENKEPFIHDLESEISSEKKQKEAELMSETLIAEHMTPEEAQEVVSQLITQENEIESAHEASDQDFEDKSREFIESGENLFDFNESETQQKSEQCLAEDSIIVTNQFEELNDNQNMSIDAMMSDISSEEPQSILQLSESQPIVDDLFTSEAMTENPKLTSNLEETTLPKDSQQELIQQNPNEGSVPLETNLDEPLFEINNEFKSQEFTENFANKIEESIGEHLSEEKECNGLLTESIDTSHQTKSQVSKPFSEDFEDYVNGLTETQLTNDTNEVMIPHTTPEIISEITSVFSEPTEEVLPEITAEEIPETTTEVTADKTPEEIPDTIPEVIPETTPEEIPDTTTEEIPDTTTEVIAETTPEVIPETTPEVIPETTPEVIPETTPEVVSETTHEISPEIITETTAEINLQTTEELEFEHNLNATQELTTEVICGLVSELSEDTQSELISNKTSEPYSELISEAIPEPTAEIEISPEIKLPTTDPMPATIESQMRHETLTDVNDNNENINKSDSTPIQSSPMVPNEPQTETNSPAVIEDIKPEQLIKNITKTKALNSKAIPSKTTKPISQTKTDPKSKPISSSIASKAQIRPLSKTTATKVSSVPTKPNLVPTTKTTTTSKSTALKTGNGSTDLTARTAARKVTPTPPTRSTTGGISKSSATTTTSAPRVASSTTRTAPNVTTKLATKAAPARAPIASRTTTTSVRSTGLSSLTATTRTNGQTTSAIGAAAKTDKSNVIRKTTPTVPKPTQTVANGTKSTVPPSKPTTIGLKSASLRPNTGRTLTATSAATKPITKPTTKPTSSSLPSKTGVKPISIKGKTGAKDLAAAKTNATAVASNGVSKTVAPMTMGSGRNNSLKMTNSLKQELEDAMSLPNIETPFNSESKVTTDSNGLNGDN